MPVDWHNVNLLKMAQLLRQLSHLMPFEINRFELDEFKFKVFIRDRIVLQETRRSSILIFKSVQSLMLKVVKKLRQRINARELISKPTKPMIKPKNLNLIKSLRIEYSTANLTSGLNPK